MEKLIGRNSRIFYVVMIAVCLYSSVKMLYDDAVVVAALLFGTTNVMLYGMALYYSYQHKWVQSKYILIALMVLTVCLWLLLIWQEFELVQVDMWDDILNQAVQCFLIEWILVTRIQTIDRLLEIARQGGGSKWKA